MRGSTAGFQFLTERYENKYLIHPSLVPKIREYIRPFCKADPFGQGDPPEYCVTTLQLDNDLFDLHYAKERETLNRFKLRVRTYGEAGDAPLFLEIKRKFRSTISKLRVRVDWEYWSEDLIHSRNISLPFKSSKEEHAFLEFLRLTREIDARPRILVRYIRECYMSMEDSYARVTFDRKLQYQPTKSWTDFGRSGKFIPMDSSVAQGQDHPFSAVILELKCLSHAPRWMLSLIKEFDLRKTGNCKYCTGLYQETLHTGDVFMGLHLMEQLPR